MLREGAGDEPVPTAPMQRHGKSLIGWLRNRIRPVPQVVGTEPHLWDIFEPGVAPRRRAVPVCVWCEVEQTAENCAELCSAFTRSDAG